MADSVEQQFGFRPDVVKGRVGVFDVRVDGDLVFSKQATGRFPEPGEIERLLERRLRSG